MPTQDTTSEKENIPQKPIVQKPVENKPEPKPESASGVIFKVQIAAVGKKIETTSANFKGLNNVSVFTENGAMYKYTYGNTSDYDTAKRYLDEAKAKGYTGAYLIAFRDGKKITIQEALK